jgi:hypothetical protein
MKTKYVEEPQLRSLGGATHEKLKKHAGSMNRKVGREDETETISRRKQGANSFSR